MVRQSFAGREVLEKAKGLQVARCGRLTDGLVDGFFVGFSKRGNRKQENGGEKKTGGGMEKLGLHFSEAGPKEKRFGVLRVKSCSRQLVVGGGGGGGKFLKGVL